MDRTIKKIFLILCVGIIIPSMPNGFAQVNETVTSEELIEFFSQPNETVGRGQRQSDSGTPRGIGGVRESQADGQAQENTYIYKPLSLPNQSSSTVPQQNPAQTQLQKTDRQQSEVRKSFQNILFDFNAFTLKESSYSQLNEIGKALKVVMAKDMDSFFIIEGHTDSAGDAEYNEMLSAKRANTVKDFLVSRFGIDRRRIMILGYGENRPIASNETEYGRSKNRRVEIVKR